MSVPKKLCCIAIVVCLVAVTNVCADGPIAILRNLIQNNLLGVPAVHEVTEWDFDPEVAIKRRELFQRTNGFRGEDLIERIGLGVDGLHNERLQIQQQRDEGLLGGTIHKIKHGINTVDYRKK